MATKRQWLITGAVGAGLLLIAGVSRAAGRTGVRLVAPGVDYAITWTDLLWLARATKCESSRAPREHMWAMIQRFVAFRQRSREWQSRSLGELVRAFSQPVNPRWQPGGDLYHRGTDPQVTRRRHICSTTSWRTIKSERPDIWAEVQAIVNGTSSSPIPTMTNFAQEGAQIAGGVLRCATVPGGRIFGGNCFKPYDPTVRGPVRLV